MGWTETALFNLRWLTLVTVIIINVTNVLEVKATISVIIPTGETLRCPTARSRGAWC